MWRCDEILISQLESLGTERWVDVVSPGAKKWSHVACMTELWPWVRILGTSFRAHSRLLTSKEEAVILLEPIEWVQRFLVDRICRYSQTYAGSKFPDCWEDIKVTFVDLVHRHRYPDRAKFRQLLAWPIGKLLLHSRRSAWRSLCTEDPLSQDVNTGRLRSISHPRRAGYRLWFALRVRAVSVC